MSRVILRSPKVRLIIALRKNRYSIVRWCEGRYGLYVSGFLGDYNTPLAAEAGTREELERLVTEFRS